MRQFDKDKLKKKKKGNLVSKDNNNNNNVMFVLYRWFFKVMEIDVLK